MRTELEVQRNIAAIAVPVPPGIRTDPRKEACWTNAPRCPRRDDCALPHPTHSTPPAPGAEGGNLSPPGCDQEVSCTHPH
ncbi:hypothetical protein GCM10010216_20700 [Streptomyces flaveolus]|nr:hypothetical protein GCM10010216_20700 [Streptomyces flaveolus]